MAANSCVTNLNGLNSRHSGKDENELNMSGSEVSSATVGEASQREGEILQFPILKSFPFSELQAATSDFCQNNLLGKGDFGHVYKGWVNKQTLMAAKPKMAMLIAVKKLDPYGSQGRQECLSEIKYLGQLQHPNLVKLIGYCLEDGHQLLAYEYMPNGSLEDHLFTGLNSRHAGKDENESNMSGSKISSATVGTASQKEVEILQFPILKSFPFSELRAATSDFCQNNLLGKGDFGHVYKGWLNKRTLMASEPEMGMLIAVKKVDPSGSQGRQECAEIKYLGQLQHPNLVKLIGYCLEDDNQLLVYEYLPKGILENHLFRCDLSFKPLSWNLRMKIALGAAKGLAFLHQETEVIHPDFKTSNILLDSNHNPKIDFGLAQDRPMDDKTRFTTRVIGTYAYLAPEYRVKGHLTAKSDVYSFGVVLLEILSGKQATDPNRPPGEQDLVEWARPYLNNKRKVLQVVDWQIEGLSLDGVLKAAELVVQCITEDPRFRLSMDEVVNMLEQIYQIKT